MPVKTFESMKVSTEFQVPEGYVLVLKADIDDLEEKVGRGEWKDKKWFRKKVGITRDDLLDDMIFRPFQHELDIENGGFVHYPEVSGDPWKFHKTKTEKWLDENFARVYQAWSKSKKEMAS